MFTIAVFAAILTSKKVPDVIQLFEHEADALACCQHWLARCPQARPSLPDRGLRLYVQYGTAHETVRIERLSLALADPGDDSAEDADADDPALLTAADRRVLRVVETLPPHERGAVLARMPSGYGVSINIAHREGGAFLEAVGKLEQWLLAAKYTPVTP